MDLKEMFGVLVVAFAGLLNGSGAWPMKKMSKFQFEHWWFIGMLTGLILIPWCVTLTLCPNAFEAYASVPTTVLIKSNLWAAGWGVANVLCGLCFVRIGVALTGAILTGLGVSLGVTLPMIVKGSGLFKDAADIDSQAGFTILLGVGIMIVGVLLAAAAGFGRDRILQKQQQKSGSFVGGLIMTVIAGILSCGISFSFVYAQGPIVEAMKAKGAGEVAANFSVWAIALLGGSSINVAYPMWLMTTKKSWGVLLNSKVEFLLSLIIGANIAAGIVLMGNGMLLLGALGASVGFGIQQASQMLGSQCLGFLSGEWKSVAGRPRTQMYAAIGTLILAAIIMAYSNTLAKH